MKNTNSIFYFDIVYLFNKRLSYKFSCGKCATLVDKNTLEIIKKYKLEKTLVKSEIEHKDKFKYPSQMCL